MRRASRSSLRRRPQAAPCPCFPALSAITRRRACLIRLGACFKGEGEPDCRVDVGNKADMLESDKEASVKPEFDNFEHGFPEGFGPSGWGYLGYAIAIAFAVFQ